jgi:hypothetical protein
MKAAATSQSASKLEKKNYSVVESRAGGRARPIHTISSVFGCLTYTRRKRLAAPRVAASGSRDFAAIIRVGEALHGEADI